MIMSFAIMPMLFCSGALYPLSTAPAWLRTVSYFDPLTYGVDALRTILLGRAGAFLPLALNIAILTAFALVMTGAAAVCYSLNRK
jgi:ABC-2 type transport system permease protein